MRAELMAVNVVRSSWVHSHVMRPVANVVWPVTEATAPSKVEGVMLFAGLLMK